MIQMQPKGTSAPNPILADSSEGQGFFEGIKEAFASFDRWRALDILIFGSSLALTAVIVRHALMEQGLTNSYAALADAFIHGHLSVAHCFDADCANYANKRWVVFPPFPAVLVSPFVALFGEGFRGFTALAGLAAIAAAVIWFKIFCERGMAAYNAFVLTCILIFGAPLFFVVYSSVGVWTFAQAIAFFLVTAAIHESLRQRLFNAGVCLGLAVLCRQFTVFLAPFIFLLSYEKERALTRIDRLVFRRALSFGIPLAGAIVAYTTYNFVRFGQPLETGYQFIGSGGYQALRIAERGLFSVAFFWQNLAYLLVQGFHVEFNGRLMTQISGLDQFGTSLLAASPFLILLAFVPFRREVVVGFLTIALMAIPMLFYHSNGHEQFNAQRYTLDWLPILFLFFPLVLTNQDRLNVLRLLGAAATGLNVVTVLVLTAARHGL
jgi:hypothetical protein